VVRAEQIIEGERLIVLHEYDRRPPKRTIATDYMSLKSAGLAVSAYGIELRGEIRNVWFRVKALAAYLCAREPQPNLLDQADVCRWPPNYGWRPVRDDAPSPISKPMGPAFTD